MAWTPITAPNTSPPPVSAPDNNQSGGWQPIGSTPTSPSISSQIVQPVAGKSQAAPVTNSSIPASALKGSAGGGYGSSNITDPTSGKPLLTYENQGAKSSQLLSDRTAPAFDPTVAQKIDPATLQTLRMSTDISTPIRKSIGATAWQELDHNMPLELGGSNNKSNLRPEAATNPNAPYSPGSNPTPTDALENSLADQVHGGKISLVDAWKLMAQAKGLTLPEQGGQVPQINQTQNNQNPDNSIGGKIKGAIGSGLDTLDSWIKGALKNTGKVADELGQNTIIHPLQTLNNIVDHAKKGADATLSNLMSAAAQVVENGREAQLGIIPFNKPKSIADTVNLMTAAASTLFFPVSETFNIASQLPVIKPAADAIGIGFNKLGQVSSYSSDAVFTKLVSSGVMKETTASTLRGPINSAAGLLAQITIGAYIYDKVGDAMTAKGGVTQSEAQTIVDEANKGADQIEKAPLPENVKSIEPPKMLVENGKDTTPVKESTGESEIVKSSNPPPKMLIDNEIGKVPTSKPAGALRPIEGTGETKTRGLSEGVISKAASNTPSRLPSFAPDEARSLEQAQIASRLTDIFGNLPQYKTMDVADQGARATKIFEEDPETAKQIAYGAKAAPKGLTPEAVFVVVEQDAIERGDTQTLKELANSRLTTEATTMGQRIRMLGERNPETPTDAIRAIQEARVEKAKKQIDTEVEKARPTVDEYIKKAKKESSSKITLDEFISSIQC